MTFGDPEHDVPPVAAAGLPEEPASMPEPQAELPPAGMEAVCLACGGWKARPLDPCAGCGHTPSERDDQARHLLVVAGELTPAQLGALAAGIRVGQTPEFDADAVTTMAAALRANRPDAHWLLFYFIIAGIPLIAFAAWWLFLRG